MPIITCLNCPKKRVLILAQNEDISGGIARRMLPFSEWTLFLKTNNDINIEIELSPEEGNPPNSAEFFEVPESPVRMLNSDSAEIAMDIEVGTIRLTGSTNALVTAIIRGKN